jgi:hypothetical protein
MSEMRLDAARRIKMKEQNTDNLPRCIIASSLFLSGAILLAVRHLAPAILLAGNHYSNAGEVFNEYRSEIGGGLLFAAWLFIIAGVVVVFWPVLLRKWNEIWEESKALSPRESSPDTPQSGV